MQDVRRRRPVVRILLGACVVESKNFTVLLVFLDAAKIFRQLRPGAQSLLVSTLVNAGLIVGVVVITTPKFVNVWGLRSIGS